VQVPGGGPGAYTHWSQAVVMTKVPEDDRPLDSYSFTRPDERIFGAATCFIAHSFTAS
jgi:hypothetical protein